MRTIAVVLLACLIVAEAHATSPKLNSTTPTGGQRGTELELRLNGARLDDTEEVFFYAPGIKVLKIESAKADAVTVKVKIAPDCRLGEHLVRIRTSTGVSDVRTFQVGAFPVVVEEEPNSELGKAQKISLNATVSGTVPSEDVDYFQVEAKKGQRLCAEVEAMRLGRGAFDVYLAVRDESGQVLAASDDAMLLTRDAFVSLVAPRDGSYFIQVRESSYGGKEDYHYRLHVGAFPRPTAVYPAGGPVGETVKVKFVGDATGDLAQELKLPATPQEKFGVFAEVNGLPAPSPNWMRVSPFPNVLEALPNQDREHATSTEVPPPMALNGIISRKGEADWFRFKAKKGQALEASVFARRLRSALDSVLEIFDASGKSVAVNDDASGPDSSLKFTASEDGDHFLRVKDHLGDGGRDYVYRVEVTPVQPTLSVNIPEVARNDSQTRQYIAVPRGNRFATMISAKRANFSGDLAFGVEGLPGGVKLVADMMSSKVDAMPLVFEAAPDAPVAGKLLDLTAKSVGSDVKVAGGFRHEIELVQGPNNTAYYGARADKLYVAVTKAAPYKLRIEEPKVPLVQAGAMDLKIVAEREPGFDEAITVKMLWNPPGVSSASDATIAKGETSVLYRLNATGEAQTRAWKIAVLGAATVNGGTLNVSSQLAGLEIAPPFVAGKIETVSTSPGLSARIVCKLEQRQPFDGKATVKLMGLPEKVTVSEKQISKDDTEVVFDLAVDAKCPTGSHKNLFCAVEVKKQGQVIPHSIGAGGILRIVPPKKGETRVAGK